MPTAEQPPKPSGTRRAETVPETRREPCERCGLVHERCKGHNSRGGPCGRAAMAGQRVCYVHGGNSPQARRKAAERIAVAEAKAEVQRLVQLREVTSEEALLESLYRTASLVEHLGNLIASTSSDAELTQFTESGRRLSVWAEWYGQERDRMANYASTCMKLGLEERQVKLAERQGELLVGVLRAVTGWLLARWREGAELAAVEAELPGIVRRELLAMSAIETTGVVG